VKKRGLFILFIVLGLITFIPVRVMAQENFFAFMPLADYRFFVENEEGEALENLQFKVYDLWNTFSYESKYDSNTGAYYFVEGMYVNPDKLNPNEIFRVPNIPGSLIKELKNLSISFTDTDDFYAEWDRKVLEMKEKNSALDLTDVLEGDVTHKAIQLNIPVVLEEVNHVGDTLPIKKIVFASIYVLPLPVWEDQILYMMALGFINNTCVYQEIGSFPEEQQGDVLKVVSSTRFRSIDYSEELKKEYSTRLVSSSEIHGEEYFNKSFSYDKFPMLYKGFGGYSVFDGMKNMSNMSYMSNMSTSISPVTAVQLRSSSDNLKEEAFADYCSSLPVLIQKKEKPKIINPPTFNDKIVLLGLSFFMIVGVAVGLFKMKKAK